MTHLRAQSTRASVTRVYPASRVAEKQASRDQDARDLAARTKTVEELRRENTFLPLSAMGKIDYRNAPRIR